MHHVGDPFCDLYGSGHFGPRKPGFCYEIRRVKVSCFEGIDLNRLFDSESEYGKNYLFDDLTDELVGRAEETMGYRLEEKTSFFGKLFRR